MEFKSGDVVRLKSGGPKMSVEEVGQSDLFEGVGVWCVWFEQAGSKSEVKRDTFPAAVLEHF